MRRADVIKHLPERWLIIGLCVLALFCDFISVSLADSDSYTVYVAYTLSVMFVSNLKFSVPSLTTKLYLPHEFYAMNGRFITKLSNSTLLF